MHEGHPAHAIRYGLALEAARYDTYTSIRPTDVTRHAVLRMRRRFGYSPQDAPRDDQCMLRAASSKHDSTDGIRRCAVKVGLTNMLHVKRLSKVIGR